MTTDESPVNGRRQTASRRRGSVPPASAVLRRALIVWGLGHVSLGDRRGWLLAALQPLAIAGVVLLAAALIDSTRWILIFPALTLLIVIWLGQAIHAHQRAIAAGAAGGGELQITFALPVILVVVTAFWLFGGDYASPAATLQAYVSAWHADRAGEAAALFAEPPAEASLTAAWQAHSDHLGRRVAETAAVHGPMSGLDPDDPFGGLRFVEVSEQATADTTVVAIDIVRRQRVEATLFGLIPTATQETVLVERAGLVYLRAVPASLPAWLPAGRPPPRLWRIEQVVLPLD